MHLSFSISQVKHTPSFATQTLNCEMYVKDLIPVSTVITLLGTFII